MTDADREARIDACRKRFQDSGLPLFDEEFSASTNVFNRAAPLLVFVFVGEMLGAIQLNWSLLENIGAALGGLAILLVVGMALNRWRGRPATAMPETVGRVEQVVFVLVLFTSQAVQVLLVSLMVAAFFILFGLIAINEAVRQSWLGADHCCEQLWSFAIFGEQFQLTTELLKVAGGLAAFTGLYFAIAMLTDATYREEFLDEITTELRSVFRVREEYLELREPIPDA